MTLAAVPDDFLGAARPASGYDIGAFQLGAVAPDGGVGPPSPQPGDSGATEGDAAVASDASLGPVDASSEDAASGGAVADGGVPVGLDGSASPPKGAAGCSCRAVDSGANGTGQAYAVLAAAALALGRRVGRRRPQPRVGVVVFLARRFPLW